ncbi:MAG TPA: MarR family transcriptional regulator [Acidothermaceae bacterium]|nr:MarR family transcriptional regulator [Acidothermaceae bacterium]
MTKVSTEAEITGVGESRPTADKQTLPLLEYLARVGRRAVDATLAPGALRTRHLIALRLLSEYGPAGQQGLADSLSLDPTNVVGLLNELEERELVTRRRDPADRRRHIVALSRRGEDELCLAYSRLRLVEDGLFNALSAVEREVLYDLLVRAAGVTSPPCVATEEGIS